MAAAICTDSSTGISGENAEMSEDVDRWFAGSSHPLKDVMLLVRRAILAADDRVEESIKWKSPTFSFEGNIASINPRAKKYVSLMFHRGADIPGSFPHLEGGGNVARYMQFADAGDVEARRLELQTVVKSWCAMKSLYDPEEPNRVYGLSADGERISG
jgi:hypothetical protein